MQARAVSEHQRATADEAAREETLLDGGFIASNDVEQTHAKSTAERAQLLETEAQQASASQDVKDCALRAPFDGEIATRRVDPGAFVTPGTTIVSVVDRSIARVVVDAPEKDFAIVSPGTPVRITLLATGAQRDAKIARRAPKADPQTRTVHFEIDLPDPERAIPADTTALVHVDVGQPVAATTIPLYAATEQEGKARVFVVENGVAHQRRLAILGESAGDLYFDPKLLAPGTTVVTEGRALLSDGDPVQPKLDTPPPGAQGSGAETRGGGYGRPL
jgi:RND family efflux transporter MFP subunit